MSGKMYVEVNEARSLGMGGLQFCLFCRMFGFFGSALAFANGASAGQFFF